MKDVIDKLRTCAQLAIWDAEYAELCSQADTSVSDDLKNLEQRLKRLSGFIYEACDMINKAGK